MAKKKAKKKFDWAKWGPIMFDAIRAFNMSGVIEYARKMNMAFKGSEFEPPVLVNANDLFTMLHDAMTWLVERSQEGWQSTNESGERKCWAVTNGYRDMTGRLVVDHEFFYYDAETYHYPPRMEDDMEQLVTPEMDNPYIRIVLDKCEGEEYFEIVFITSSQTW